MAEIEIFKDKILAELKHQRRCKKNWRTGNPIAYGRNQAFLESIQIVEQIFNEMKGESNG